MYRYASPNSPLRRVDQPHQRPHAGDGGQRQRRRRGSSDEQRAGDRLSHPLLILHAEIAGGDKGEADREARAEPHHQIKDGRACSDGGQRMLAEKIADDRGIDRVVKALECI